jgi:hypothetical protein
MADYHVVVTLASQSGETADYQVNTFAFESTGGLDSGSAGAYTAILKTLYDTLVNSDCLCGIADTGHVVKYYLATTDTPNYPLFTNTFNLSFAPGAVDLPLEVSLCISFANDTETGVSPKRRKGRIYVSGFKETGNTAGRPVSGVMTNMLTAFVTYVEAVNTLSGATACIWSRREDALFPIERVWIDNEWDTMRSRGGKSTARQTELIA